MVGMHITNHCRTFLRVTSIQITKLHILIIMYISSDLVQFTSTHATIDMKVIVYLIPSTKITMRHSQTIQQKSFVRKDEYTKYVITSKIMVNLNMRCQVHHHGGNGTPHPLRCIPHVVR